MRKITLSGFVFLAVILITMSFWACSQQAPAPTTTAATPPVTVTQPPVTTTTPTTTTPTSTTWTLSSIALSPASPAPMSSGKVLYFTAVGTYSDGSNQDISNFVTWNSSNPSVATITTIAIGSPTSVSTVAMVVTEGPGVTNITASLSGITSPAATLTVSGGS